MVSIYSRAATTAADSNQIASLVLRHHTVHLAAILVREL